MAFTETTSAWVSPTARNSCSIFPLRTNALELLGCVDSSIASFPQTPPDYRRDVLSRSHWPTMASSLHPGGVNAGFADGSVHFIKNSINSWPSCPRQPARELLHDQRTTPSSL